MYLLNNDENYCAFIDESGNFGFNFDAKGTSSHFLITAIIVKRDKVQSLRNSVDQIRSKYFGQGEIKSSSISQNHSLRFKILHDLLDLDFKILTIVVDKQEIFRSSAIRDYKRTFIKYLNSILHKELRLLYSTLEIWSDAHGTDNFMIEFDKYINKIPTYSLFDEYMFHFSDSKDEPLIQLADLICGTVSFGFEKQKKGDYYKGYYNLLKDKIVGLKTWPIRYESYLANIDLVKETEFDKKIATYCLRLTTKFVKENIKSKDPLDLDRVSVLQYLANQLYAYSSNRYVHSRELINYINGASKLRYNNQTFKTNIIAGLRDNNVIISSSANGYKIPVSAKELHSYTNLTLGMVIPMLDRLNNCRQRILSATIMN